MQTLANTTTAAAAAAATRMARGSRRGRRGPQQLSLPEAAMQGLVWWQQP
jgi:hypothetical protein